MCRPCTREDHLLTGTALYRRPAPGLGCFRPRIPRHSPQPAAGEVAHHGGRQDGEVARRQRPAEGTALGAQDHDAHRPSHEHRQPLGRLFKAVRGERYGGVLRPRKSRKLSYLVISGYSDIISVTLKYTDCVIVMTMCSSLIFSASPSLLRRTVALSRILQARKHPRLHEAAPQGIHGPDKRKWQG